MNELTERKMRAQMKLNQLAFSVAVTALFSLLVFPIFMPPALASLAIILAELAKGGREHLHPAAKKTLIISALAIGISAGLLVFVIFSFYRVINDPALREQASTLMYQRYGYTLEEFLQSLGINL